MNDTYSVNTENKHIAKNLDNTEKNSKNEGLILENNVKFLLKHFEEINDYHFQSKSSSYKIKEIVSLLIGNTYAK
jgi:hypothetical protein